jgi:hypothetical protein
MISVLDSNNDSTEELGPWLYDFKKYIALADSRVDGLQNEIKNSKNDNTKYISSEEPSTLQDGLKLLESMRPADQTDIEQTLRMGKFVQSHMEVVEYSGHSCFLDLGAFEIDATRIPQGGFDAALSAPQVVGSDEGVLCDVFLDPEKAIAGVYLDWKSNGKKSEEFFVLPEDSKHNEFAKMGDFGASVITNEGTIVGLIFARTSIDDVEIIIDKKNRIPEIATIAEKSRSDGYVDTKGLTTGIFRGESFAWLNQLSWRIVTVYCRERIPVPRTKIPGFALSYVYFWQVVQRLGRNQKIGQSDPQISMASHRDIVSSV